MRTALASAVVLAGAAFMFAAALGVARLPDLYTRMQAATKAATVGVAGMMCGVAVAHDEASVTIRAVLVAGFFLLTSPVAAHAIARSAHTRRLPLAPGTRIEVGDARDEDHAAGPGGASPPGGGPQRHLQPGSTDGSSPAERAGADEVRQ